MQNEEICDSKSGFVPVQKLKKWVCTNTTTCWYKNRTRNPKRNPERNPEDDTLSTICLSLMYVDSISSVFGCRFYRSRPRVPVTTTTSSPLQCA